MRIILDSNVYVADFRMEGIAFSNLFDYIRKTRSTLVLPRIVREEVVHRYIERFTAQVRETAKSWKSFRYLMLDHRPTEFQKPDLKYQVRELRKRLRAPANGVAIQYSPDVSGVDINEVAIRGIRRIPPASLDGEELRDVIIWYQVLSLSKGVGDMTAFVSSDAGFWDGESVKAQIQQDIVGSRAKIEVYKGIDSFIKANSPRHTQLTTDSAAQLVPASLFSELVAPVFAASLKRAARSALMYEIFACYGGHVDVLEMKPVASRFLDGTTYEIDSAVSFVTVIYEYKSKAVLKLSPDAARNGPTFTSLMGANDQSTLWNPLGALAQSDSFLSANPLWLSTQEKIASMKDSERVKEVTAVGRASVSARTVDGLVTEKALENFVLTKVEIENKEVEISEVIGPRGPWLRATTKETSRVARDKDVD
ncbi:MAG TPA: PIN domain-containing protein [Terriglobales bacterium]|jgi:hypothetical protein